MRGFLQFFGYFFGVVSSDDKANPVQPKPREIGMDDNSPMAAGTDVDATGGLE